MPGDSECELEELPLNEMCPLFVLEPDGVLLLTYVIDSLLVKLWVLELVTLP